VWRKRTPGQYINNVEHKDDTVSVPARFYTDLLARKIRNEFAPMTVCDGVLVFGDHRASIADEPWLAEGWRLSKVMGIYVDDIPF